MRNHPTLLNSAQCLSLLGLSLLGVTPLAMALLAVVLCMTAACFTMAAENEAADQELLVRELFIPFEDLHVLLQKEPRRVFLSRTEYDELLAKAKTSPTSIAPHAAVLADAQYTATVGQDRAQLSGTLVIEVLREGLHAVPLDLGGVGLRSATLDGQGAAIGRSDKGQLVLFVEGMGRHELTLQMVAPLQTTAARQVLQFRLPRAAAARMTLTVPGDVEIKGGAEVVSRVVDAQAEVTRFELLPPAGDASLVMTLNSRLKRQQRAVVARSVFVDEVTSAYEKLHATVSLDILHQAVDHFRFVVPEGFEITKIDSPLLSRWDVQQTVVDGKPSERILNAWLREPTTETVVLNIAAIKTPSADQPWTFPRSWQFPALRPVAEDVVGQVAVLGLLVEEYLQADSIAGQEELLIPIDVEVLSRAMPASLFEAQPGHLLGIGPRLKTVVAYYAPQSDFTLSARIVRPEAKLAVTSNLLLVLSDQGQEVLGGLAMVPDVEKRFAFDFTMPEGWNIKSVTAAGEKPLPFERYKAQAGRARIHVRVPEGIPPGSVYQANFQAVYTPPDWLGEWDSQAVAFPLFVVEGADPQSYRGAIAIEARDDMTVRPEGDDLPIPLHEAEKAEYGLEGVATNLAYRHEGPHYEAALRVERTQPQLTAKTYSFLRIEPGALFARYEIIYDIKEARTRRLALLLPKDTTPETLTITGLDGVQLKQYDSETVDLMRRWNVELAEPRRDTVRLAVDFQRPLPDETLDEFALPLVKADGVDYQSGLVAVEGSAELDVDVKTHLRRVDVGELVDAEYQPGRRLLGAYEFVGDSPQVTVDVSRDPAYELPSAIVQSAELRTFFAPDGANQTQAQFSLRTKALYLEVKLPPNSELWSAFLDDVPLKPQRKDDRLLVSLPAQDVETPRSLRVAYATDPDASLFGNRVTAEAPKLFLLPEASAEPIEVPLADLRWLVHPPAGYEVVNTGGTVATEGLPKPEPAAITTAKGLFALSGGFYPFALFAPASREASRRFDQVGMDAGEELFEGLDDAAGEIGVDYDRDDPFGEDLPEEEAPAEDMPADAEEPAPPESRPAEVAVKESLGAEGTVLDSLELKVDHGGARRETRAPKKPVAKSLAGVRSLEVDFERVSQYASDGVAFRSLGTDPRLELTMAKSHRRGTLAWGLALGLVLIGLAITNRTLAVKVRFLLAVGLVTTAGALFWDNLEVVRTCNTLFYAAVGLVPYYLVVALAKWFCRLVVRRWRPSPVVATAVALMLLMGVAGPSVAAEETGPYVIQIVEPTPPVEVPEDALIVPYDSESEDGIQNADRILVPYAKYVELWNRAFPDKKIEDRKPPADYALAGASYEATLQDDEFLLLSGWVDIDVYVDGHVSIPLGLRGGVLARAVLDGKPARLSVAQVAPEAQQAEQSQQAAQLRPDGSLIMLYVTGKGRHRLEVAVRLRLTRRGGWRIARGAVPAAEATALALTAPEAQTEVRLAHVADRPVFETQQPDETTETALAANGTVDIQWRPKVAQGQIDRSLTAESLARLDVQEDGLRLVWRLQLKFRDAERDRFDIEVPAEYLLERVEGENVRGWELNQVDGRQTAAVTLLNVAKEQETFTLHLWRGGAVGQDELSEFDVPTVGVADAALHNGRLAIRRSPLLNLRTLQRQSVTRTDLKEEELLNVDEEKSPLGIRPYQAYRFATMPFAVRLAVAPVAAKVTATIQTVLRIAEYQRSLESRIVLHVQDRPAHRLEILIPADLNLKHVSAPGQFQWALTDVEQEDQRLLTIYLGAGQQGDTPVLLRGTLGRPGTTEQVASTSGRRTSLPRIEVRNVARQQGDIAVQIDPAFRVEANDLQNCRRIDRLEELYGWLNPDQRNETRLGIRYPNSPGRSPDYSGTLSISPRAAVVTCTTITNVRLTDRAIEETLLLNFTIRDAGISQLSFRLPAEMEGCRISVPMLRQKTIDRDEDGTLSVRLQLQDEMMGELKVLVEADRLLQTGKTYAAPVPTIETGQTQRRFVALQSTGRDEVAVEKHSGLRPLIRQQEDWQTLKAVLGSGITMAYMVEPGAQQPSLLYKTQDRQIVETAGARIGLAQTVLVLDGNGTYRAAVTYHLDNTTEQYLKIQLPPQGKLWAARVAGEPVKPTRDPKATDTRLVRIPLVKTAPGDLDYLVVLKYSGQIPRRRSSDQRSLGRYDSVDFPLVHTRNINVELSQVQLYVPKTHQWFDFAGTMRQVTDEAELAAGVISYQTKQTEELMQAFRGFGKFAKLRAYNNLKQISMELRVTRQKARGWGYNEKLNSELEANSSLLRQAEQEVQEFTESEQKAMPVGTDNRARLNESYEGQKTTRARNVVQQDDKNWDIAQQQQAVAGGKRSYFNDKWLSDNKLGSEADGKDQAERGKKTSEKIGGRRFKTWHGGTATVAAKGQLNAPEVAQGKAKAELSKSLASRESRARNRRRSASKERDTLERYQQQLEQQQDRQQRTSQVLGRQYTRFDQPRSQTQAAGTQVQRGGTVQAHLGSAATLNLKGGAQLTELSGVGGVGGQGFAAGMGGARYGGWGRQLGESVQQVAGLASLDVELPELDRFYQVYHFTTPRGETRISARATSRRLMTDFGRLGTVAVIFAVILGLIHLARTGRFVWLTQPAGSTTLICVGLLALVIGILPLFALVALVAGITLKIRGRIARRQLTPAKA